MREVSKRVTLLQATLFGDQLVAAGERYRLERDERDLLRILESEADDRADLVVVDAVDQRRHENDVNAGFVQVVDRTKFYVEQVADLAVRVGVVADAVELQINKSQVRLRLLRGKILSILRTRYRWSRPAPSCNQPCVHSGPRRGSKGDSVGSPPEYCTDIWRRGLIWIALSRISLTSSIDSSWTKPTWFASMKHGSHIMLQRFVRSTVSTAPRPYLIVDVP